MTRTGKIARLPREVRERLNTRIENGDLGTELVDWLNGEAEVKRVLQEHFNGRPISEQNLSEWKNGGYVEWQARQEIFDQARELDADGADLASSTGGRLTDRLATVLAARYAAVLGTWNGQISEEFENTLRILHALCRHIAILRRGEHHSARLAMEQERPERGRTKSRSDSDMTEEEREAAINEILGLPIQDMNSEQLEELGVKDPKKCKAGNRAEVGGLGTEEKRQSDKATDEHRLAQMKCEVGGQSEEIRVNQSGSNQGEPLSLTLSPLGRGEGTKSGEIKADQTNLRIGEASAFAEIMADGVNQRVQAVLPTLLKLERTGRLVLEAAKLKFSNFVPFVSLC